MPRLRMLFYVLGGLMAVVYLLNPGAGFIELIPDGLPIIGNVDEASMMALLIACFRGFRTQRALLREAPANALPPGGHPTWS